MTTVSKGRRNEMKTALIIPYFGKFPNYFQLFLNSCRRNKEFTWLIFTDCIESYDYPDNVEKIQINFDELRKYIQSKFDFKIELSNPKKLCDYKCAYGYIFEEYLQQYDFWGYSDVDLIFGDLGKFLTANRLNCFDKIYSLGHLTVYRNLPEINRVFMKSIHGRERYKEVFQDSRGCAFDEWYPNNINEIFMTTSYRLCLENECADVEAYKTNFVLNYYDFEKKKYAHRQEKNIIFEWREGRIIQLSKKNGQIQEKEYPYVHLQKRAMKCLLKDLNTSEYYIIPNRFIEKGEQLERYFVRNKILKIFNFQFLKVKLNTLRYRIKSCDWNFRK